MAEVIDKPAVFTVVERERRYARNFLGGRKRQMTPQLVDSEASCPHPGCGHPLQAIDFRLEDHGRAVHDPQGLVGRHAIRRPVSALRRLDSFTVRGKRALTAVDATAYPRLLENWHEDATSL